MVWKAESVPIICFYSFKSIFVPKSWLSCFRGSATYSLVPHLIDDIIRRVFCQCGFTTTSWFECRTKESWEKCDVKRSVYLERWILDSNKRRDGRHYLHQVTGLQSSYFVSCNECGMKIKECRHPEVSHTFTHTHQVTTLPETPVLSPALSTLDPL